MLMEQWVQFCMITCNSCTVPYPNVPSRTVPCRAVPYRTVPYRTVPYRTHVPGCTVLVFVSKNDSFVFKFEYKTLIFEYKNWYETETPPNWHRYTTNRYSWYNQCGYGWCEMVRDGLFCLPQAPGDGCSRIEFAGSTCIRSFLS